MIDSVRIRHIEPVGLLSLSEPAGFAPKKVDFVSPSHRHFGEQR